MRRPGQQRRIGGWLMLCAAHVGACSQVTRAAENDQSGLEEIIVTAQRRGESLQDVPIAVSAIDAQTAARMGLSSSVDIPVMAPAVNFVATIGGAGITIRGIGATGTAGDESANAVYVDGVYQAALPALVLSLNNIERIEVLKGPQGTLFGRNASGGLIQIITSDPEASAGVDLDVGYGNYQTFQGNLYATSGISETVAADIALFAEDQGEGWGTNQATGRDVYQGSAYAARTKWRWQPGESTQIKLAASYSETELASQQGGQIIEGNINRAGTGNVGFYEANSNTQTTYGTQQKNASITLEHDFDAFRFLSITSYDDTFLEQYFDQDASTLNFVTADVARGSDTWTQELQLQSQASASFSWIGGLFYYFNEQTAEPLRVTGLATGAAAYQDTYSTMQTQSYAAYGQTTFGLAPRTNLTLGLRYTIDDRDLESAFYTNLVPQGTNFIQQSNEDSKLTWRIALDYRFADDVLGYISHSRGFKSGLFNITAPANPAVLPQTVDAYEVGLKTELFDQRVRLNGAVFYNDFTDIQVRAIAIGQTIILNAAAATTRGADIDFQIAAADHLTLLGGLAYLDGEYSSFPGAPFFFPQPTGGSLACPPPPTNPAQVAACTARGALTTNAAGNATINSPQWVATLGGQYRIPTRAGDLLIAATFNYNDGFFWDPQNRVPQPSYEVVNASVAWESASKAWSLKFWGRNLSGSEYFANENSSGLGDIYYPAPPRTYGVSFGWHSR